MHNTNTNSNSVIHAGIGDSSVAAPKPALSAEKVPGVMTMDGLVLYQMIAG